MATNVCTVVLAGVELVGAKDSKGNYHISVPSFEKATGIRSNSTRKICRSKWLKDALGKDLPLGKKRVGESTVSFIPAQYFGLLLQYAATVQSNRVASALMTATLIEAIERRIDSALNVVVPEQTYEERTRAFFRELARSHFRPDYCEWLKQYEVCPNYGAEVNKLKTALKLPLEACDTYSPKQMVKWASGIIRYDGLRLAGYGHKRALHTLALATEVREETQSV